MATDQHYAVLTGDIIQSRRLKVSELDQVRASLKGAIASVRDWYPGLVLGEIDFFRGDSWQVLLARPRQALRVALFLRASLIAGGIAGTRMGIGLGKGEEISADRVTLSTGEAFTLSGSSLDHLPGSVRMNLAVPASAPVLSIWVTASIHLCDALVQQWTRRQAEVVQLAIHPGEPTQDEMAAALKPTVSRQAVSKVLVGANWPVLAEVLRKFEATAWEDVLP